MRSNALKLALATLLTCASTLPGAEAPGGWKELGKSGGAQGGATVYLPACKQVVRWGGIRGTNALSALNLSTGAWTPDYTGDACDVGGNFYGGQNCAAWLKTNRPGQFYLFRQACWDSKRNRLLAVMLNLTTAYDPTTKEWTDLKCGYSGRDGVRQEGAAPKTYQGTWFAAVPGQWGSCAYDPLNDEVILFPLWVTRTYEWTSTGGHKIGPDLLDDAGIRSGHFGTFAFDCATNTWTNPELGCKEILAARAALADAIGAQREAVRAGWLALLALRQEQPADTASRMSATAEAQKGVLARLTALKAELEKHAAALQGPEATQARDAAKALAATQARLEQALAGFAAAKAETLPALHGIQEACYRDLRVIRDTDLYVQPPGRCSTSIVYDAKHQVMVMAGGTHLDRTLNDTWIYRCKTKRWERAAPAPEGMEWPGMCYDSKRGLTIYAAAKGTYAFDAGKNQWFKAGPGIPKYQSWNFYCDMAYDEAADRYVLNIARDKYSADETTFVLEPTELGEAVTAAAAMRETPAGEAFPPLAVDAARERITSMPVNRWVLAKPNFEPTHRSWSTMSWDEQLRCVVYEGGGHAGTMDNTISAYFPESNTWVNAFPAQHPPSIFGNWCCAGSYLAFERGMGLSQHCRYYESYAGDLVAGSSAGFQWATREHPADFSHTNLPPGQFCLDEAQGRLVFFDHGKVSLYDLKTRKTTVLKLQGPVPNIGWEWSGMDVHPDKNWLVLHGAGDRNKKTDTETWILDLAQPASWKKLDLKTTTPPVGMSKLSAIPGTPLLVCALPESNDLWVLNLDTQSWKPLPANDGDDKLPTNQKRFEIYGQCVYDPHHQLIIMVGLRGGSYDNRHTYLLKPDFKAIDWSR